MLGDSTVFGRRMAGSDLVGPKGRRASNIHSAAFDGRGPLWDRRFHST